MVFCCGGWPLCKVNAGELSKDLPNAGKGELNRCQIASLLLISVQYHDGWQVSRLPRLD